MDQISDVKMEPLRESQYVKPYRMLFKQNGSSRIWDLVALHDSVNILIFNVERKKLIFVKQFRPAVYYSSNPKEEFLNENLSVDLKHAGSEGVTLELCAGIVDKTKDLTLTAQTEVLEECGYDVPLNKFEQIISYRGGVGVSGEKLTSFYVEVDDSMKVSDGGGVASEGELIEVVEMSIEEVKQMLLEPYLNSPAGFLFGVMWFIQHKAHLYTD